MSVYVINQRKQPLMPTTTQKARKLLKQGKAKIVKREPFTIKLLYATFETKQEINLGVGALCISGNSTVKRNDNWYCFKKVRCHNRQNHKVNILKGGKKLKLIEPRKTILCERRMQEVC